MTDKIMIDGIDVSECESLYKDSYNDFCCSSAICEGSPCNPIEMSCSVYVESLKQQIQRFEQECEELKKELSSLLAEKNAMEIGRYEYKQRCKELEDRLDEIEKLTTIREVHGLTDTQYVENFRLHQERISGIINKAKEN